MEPIIKVTSELEYESNYVDKQPYIDTDFHYFHSIEQAKRWCEKQLGKPIEWENSGDLNPYLWWSPEIETTEGLATFYMEPIEITVLDEEDGEV